jgi:hypothetical protein
MALSYKRIYQIALSALTNLLTKQIGVETVEDSDLNFKMWGGKDADGNVTKWLAKDKPASVTNLITGFTGININDQSSISMGGHGNNTLIITSNSTISIVTIDNNPICIGNLSVSKVATNYLISTGYIVLPIVPGPITSAYPICDQDYTVCFDDSGLTEDLAITLPAANALAGRILIFSVTGGNGSFHFVITPDGLDTIENRWGDPENLYKIDTSAQCNQKRTLQSDGVSNWVIISLSTVVIE